jgi:hypothetical protein
MLGGYLACHSERLKNLIFVDLAKALLFPPNKSTHFNHRKFALVWCGNDKTAKAQQFIASGAGAMSLS